METDLASEWSACLADSVMYRQNGSRQTCLSIDVAANGRPCSSLLGVEIDLMVLMSLADHQGILVVVALALGAPTPPLSVEVCAVLVGVFTSAAAGSASYHRRAANREALNESFHWGNPLVSD